MKNFRIHYQHNIKLMLKSAKPGSDPLKGVSTALAAASGISGMKDALQSATSELDESLTVKMDKVLSKVTDASLEEGNPKGSE